MSGAASSYAAQGKGREEGWIYTLLKNRGEIMAPLKFGPG